LECHDHEIESRDHQLSQSAQQVASLQAQLEQMMENVAKLESKLDSTRQKYNSSVQHSAGLESEMVRIQEQLNSSQHQVSIVVFPQLCFVNEYLCIGCKVYSLT